MSHTHKHNTWSGLTTIELAINPVFGECGLVHTNSATCVVVSYDLSPVAAATGYTGLGSEEDKEDVSSPVGDSFWDHTHTYVRVIPSGNVNVLHSYVQTFYNCNTADTRYTRFGTIAGSASGYTVVTGTTSPPIVAGEQHYHTYNQARNHHIGGKPRYLGPCRAGHTNCIVTEWAGYNIWMGATESEQETSLAPNDLITPASTDVQIVALEALRNIEMSAMGRVYVDESGNLCYENRYARQL